MMLIGKHTRPGPPFLTRARATGAAALCVASLAVLVLADDALGQIPDHFTCYKARTTSGTPKFVAVPGVSLVDGFRSSTVEAKKPKLLCAPTNKNGEDPTAPAHPDHLKDYLIKPVVKFTTVANQRIDDQFGTHFVDVKKPVGLQVPAGKSLALPFPPDPANPAVDHFTCYKVRTTKGTPKFVKVPGVTLQDQFGSMTVEVKRIRRLCAPTNKNNEEPGAQNHPDHLMCYLIKQTSLPKFVTVSPLFVNDQFGQQQVDAKKPFELCVPALRNMNATPTPTSTSSTPTRTPTPTATATPPPNCGNGMVDPGESCDGGLGICPGGAPCTDLCTCGCVLPNPIPDRLAFVNRTGRDSDTGSTGLSHDLPGNDDSPFVAVSLSDCDTTPASSSCGTCTYTGPVAFPGVTKTCYCLELGPNRDGSSRAPCDPEASTCTSPETCECIYGPPLPLTSGAISACILNRVAEPIVGTVNIADIGPHSGESAGFLHLESGAHTAPTQAEACPRCLGDAAPRDGIKGGTCSYGAQIGDACDAAGVHALFGTLSFDCLPSVGANIGNLTILIPNQTTQTSTLATTGVKCTAPGFQTEDCFCDTCATAAAEPCNSNGDCPNGTQCGGRRCIGGSNSGQACTTGSQCPGGGCGRPGFATQTNSCDDTICSPDLSDPFSPNDGVCAAGPVDGYCDVEGFRGCGSDGDCNPPPAGTCPDCAPGQTCVPKFRECFLNPIVRVGTPGTRKAIIATTFCIPPSASSAVNAAPGVPGAGSALEPTCIYRVGTSCGNGTIDAGEACDPPAGGTCPTTCLPSCQCPTCGDGCLNQPSEECDGDDDRNCPGQCQPGCTCTSTCGNDTIEFGEECDGTATGGDCPPAACQGNCTCGPFCGDNAVDPGEECDGAGSVVCPADACIGAGQPSECTCGPYCGDDTIDPGEECDGTALGSCSAGCLSDCTCQPVCGNNMREAGELCDGTDAPACPGECAPDCTCPSIGELSFSVKVGTDLDAGWTGTSHDFPWVIGAKIPGVIGGCDNVTDFDCTFFANVGSFCSGDPTASCTANSQCPVGQSCVIQTFGPPLPLTSGGVPACVVPIFREDVTGTYNLTTGATSFSLPITAVVHVGTSTLQPCPVCNCNSAGTCNGGANNGAACSTDSQCPSGFCRCSGICSDNPLATCTVEGTSPFGPTSNSCKPNPAGDISAGGLVLSVARTCAGGSNNGKPCTDGSACPGGTCPAQGQLTTGTFTFASSQPCDGPGFQTQSCWGDGQAQPSACANACNGGGNDAEACTNASECPGGTCVPLCRSIAGQTRPGQGVQPTGEAECVAGPFDTVCSGNPFITCSQTQPCPPGLGSCVGETRRCFLDPIVRVGSPGTTNDSTVGAFFVPSTDSPAINQVAGLPGAGAIAFPMAVDAKFCGDGVRNRAEEECDGGDLPAGCPSCALDCTCNTTCGNMVVEFGEQCDGLGPQSTACPATCIAPPDPAQCTCPPVCGDGFKAPTEECDPGGPGATPPPPDDAACPGQCAEGLCTCPAAQCGNGMIEAGEVCELPAVGCGPLQACVGCAACLP